MQIVLSDAFDIEDPFQGHRDLNCPLYIRMNGTAFPYEEWDEMAVTVIYWWIGQAAQGLEKFNLRFMEGPYWIECSRKGEMVHLACINDRFTRYVACEEEIEMRTLLDELRKAAVWLVRQVERHGWNDINDFEYLKNYANYLEGKNQS